MIFKNLPAQLNKKDAEGKQLPNIVKISNQTLKPEQEEPTVFEIPAEKFIYPQVESQEEMVTICGTMENLIDTFNDVLRDASTSESKNSIRMAKTGEPADIIEAAILKGKNFTFVASERISAAEAKEKFSELRNIAKTEGLTDAELAAKVRAMLGA